MDNNQFNEPGQPVNSNQTDIPNQPISSATLPEQPTAESHHPRRPLFLIISCVLSLILVAIGIFMHITYKAHDESGKTIADLEAEIVALQPEIDALEKAESDAFSSTGFSNEYFTAANETSELKSEKDVLVDTIEELNNAEATKSVITTGALWFFIGAAIILVLGITVYLRF